MNQLLLLVVIKNKRSRSQRVLQQVAEDIPYFTDYLENNRRSRWRGFLLLGWLSILPQLDSLMILSTHHLHSFQEERLMK